MKVTHLILTLDDNPSKFSISSLTSQTNTWQARECNAAHRFGERIVLNERCLKHHSCCNNSCGAVASGFEYLDKNGCL